MYVETKAMTDFSHKAIKKNLKQNEVLQNFEKALKAVVEQLYVTFTEHKKMKALCALLAETNIEKVVFPGTCDEMNNYWRYPYVVLSNGTKREWQDIEYLNQINGVHTTASAEKEVIALISEINEMLRDAPIFSCDASIVVTGTSVVANLGVYRGRGSYNQEALAFLASMVKTGFEEED